MVKLNLKNSMLVTQLYYDPYIESDWSFFPAQITTYKTRISVELLTTIIPDLSDICLHMMLKRYLVFAGEVLRNINANVYASNYFIQYTLYLCFPGQPYPEL